MMNHKKDSLDTTVYLQAIANNTTDALIAINSEGKVISWNLAAELLFQYAQKEILGKPVHIIIPDRYKKLHEAGLKRVNSGGEKHVIGSAVELEGVKKSGEEFPIELTLSVWETENGKNYGGIIRDISERKKIEQELNLTNARFRSILESASDAIITADSKGLILSWNKASAHIFGYLESEVIGKPLTVIIPSEFKDAYETGIKRVSSGGEQHVIGKTVELVGLKKNGLRIPIELSVSTWTIGEDRYFSGIIRDISERKAIEAEHRATEMKFQSIAESATDAIISANEKGDIKSWNFASEKIFGYTEDEVLGKSLTVIIPEKYRKLHEAGINRVAKGGAHHVIGHSVELEGLHKDGHIFPIELSLSTWKVNKNVFYSGIIRDITSRKKDEEKLKKQKQKLAEKAASLKKLNQEVEVKNEQLQQLSNKLAKYLSRQVYTNIFEGKKDVKIESYRKKLTIFFSDIQGFTEITDRIESEVLTNILNSYLNEMSKIATAFGGTIDKYIGDAIMIFFGDPETHGEKNDAIACVKMAIAMREKLVEMRREWDKIGITTPLHVRMGVNTGFCTVGNFGSDERLDYTIVGGAVNLASRLESSAQVDQVLISDDTYSLIKDVIKCEPNEEIKVKGMAYPVKTYTVIGLYEELNEENDFLSSQLDGFDLSIDFRKLKESDRNYARELLEKVMNKL